MNAIIEIQEQLNRIETGLLAQKKVLNFDEACLFTGLQRSSLYKLTSTNRIPHFKPRGKMIYFEREILEGWLLQNPVKTVQEIESEASAYIAKNRK